MPYNSYLYILFLIIAVLGYYCIPIQYRWIELLIANIIYYLMAGFRYSFYFAVSIFTVYCAGRIIEHMNATYQRKQMNLEKEDKKLLKNLTEIRIKRLVIGTILLNAGILIFRKYCLFAIFNINRIFELFHSSIQIPQITFALPLGISFYTLSAIGYLIDVGRGQYPAEKNIFKFILFMTFFPHILEGPICRYSQTAEKLSIGHKFSKDNFFFGVQRICWGLLKKIVIADRMDILVNHIYANYTSYSGTLIIVVALAYTVQLYAEFSGCMDIVLGSAQLFGITLPENFDHPFASESIQEYWRRWHITLGTWFKDYLFYPVSLSKPVKAISKKMKKQYHFSWVKLTSTVIALFFVWTFTGMWHGGSFRYLLYGWYYFLIIATGLFFEPYAQRACAMLHIKTSSIWYRWFKRIRTFILIVIGLMIFRATTITQFLKMFLSIPRNLKLHFLFDGTLLKLGLDEMDWIVLAIGILLMILVGMLQVRGVKIRMWISQRPLFVRWPMYYILVLSIILFGAYGKGYVSVPFIYANF